MVKIVTDSTCDLTTEQAAQLGITAIASLYVLFGKKTFQDGITINNDQFYAKLKTDPNFPSTSQPSIGDFTHIYEKYKGESIVSIHVSRDLSGTISSAESAAKMVGGDITIIDSRNVNAGLSLLVARACRMAQEGASSKDIQTTIEALVPRTRLHFALETLENLHRGGRIGGAQAFLGSMLQFKPIITIKDGRVEPLERVRTMPKATAKLREITADELKNDTNREFAFMHANARAAAVELQKACTEQFHLKDTMVIEAGPVVATHSGPGAVGIAYIL